MDEICNVSLECGSVSADQRQLIFIPNPEEMVKPWNNNSHFLPIMVTHAVTFLFGITGNVIIITTMTRDKSSRNATSMFLVSLAVADLLLVVVCIPLETLHYVVITSDQEGTICKLSSYGEMLSAVASVLNLTAVSLERYIVIVYPMKSRSFCTISNCRRALVVVWVVALILSVPVTITRGSQPLIYTNNITNVTIYYCWDGDDKDGLPLAVAVYQFCIMFAVPCLLMIFCYSRVIKELWISTKAMTAMTRVSSKKFDSRGSISAAMRNSTMRGNVSPGSTTNSLLRHNAGHKTGLATGSDEVRQARKQVIKMLILVIVLFLVCWGPRVIMQLLIKHGLSVFSQTAYAVRNFFTLLPFVHSCLNPIIYSFMSSNFRRMMMRSCTGHHPCATVNSCCRSGSMRNHHQPAPATVTYELSINSEASSRVYHPSAHYTCSNTCTSDTRTSPITECETMIHEVMSSSAYDLGLNNGGELGNNKFHSCEPNVAPCFIDKYDDNSVIM